MEAIRDDRESWRTSDALQLTGVELAAGRIGSTPPNARRLYRLRGVRRIASAHVALESGLA